MPNQKQWNLVADIGGTNARFAVHDVETDELKKVIVLSVAEHPSFMGALQHTISHIQGFEEWASMPAATCLAVACPAEQELIQFTNSAWQFTKSELAEALDHLPAYVINDFSAVAYSIPALKPFEVHQIGGRSGLHDQPIAILGPGTGLGVGTLVPVDDDFIVVDGEGGHIDFAPLNEREIEILRILRKRFDRVSVERLLSGSGLVNIYEALCILESSSPQYHNAKQITDAAIKGEDNVALETFNIFCKVLGSTASNLALIAGAKGGVYIAGGIAPRFVEFIEKSDLRQRFEDKGRFKKYVKDIPVYIILKEHLGLFGAMQKLKLDHQVS